VVFVRGPERRLLPELYLAWTSVAPPVVWAYLFQLPYQERRALAWVWLQETYLVCPPEVSLLEGVSHVELLQAKWLYPEELCLVCLVCLLEAA
jgi:hypothetical protein